MKRNFFAGLLVFLFVVFSTPVILAFGLFNTFLDSSFYDDNFIDVLYDFTVDELPALVTNNKQISGIAPTDIRELIKDVFLKEDLKIVVDSIVEQFSTVQVSSSGTATVKIPVDWIISKQDTVIDKIVTHLSQTLPVCDKIHTQPSNADNICVPTGVARDDFAGSLRKSIDIDIAGSLPNDSGFTLNNLPEFLHGETLSKYITTLITRIFVVGLLFLFILLFLLALIISHPWIRILKWEAKAIFLSTFISSIFLFLIFILPIKLVPPDLLIFAHLYSFLIGSVIGKLVFYLSPIMFASLGFWIFGILFDKKKK